VLLGKNSSGWKVLFCSTHHLCLGSERQLPYAAARGKKSVNRRVLDELKQHIPLLEYLQAHAWQPARALSRGRWMGLCPLHTDHKPSFLVDPNKSLFYCYGCGRGGDVIRFAELYHQVNFPKAITLLREWCGLAPLLNAVVDCYRIQLHRYHEALAYLDQRGIHSCEVIEHMRIGYAPGGCLRSCLMQLGYPLLVMQRAGLVNAAGHDSYSRRIVFPLDGNLYGRCVLSSSSPHLFMTGLERWPLLVGARPTISRGDPCGRPVRLCRFVASRLSQCHLLSGKSSQRTSVSATMRSQSDRVPGLRC
jgi:CHC2 zinc finger/DNA primase catalytic core, N-terminal domain